MLGRVWRVASAVVVDAVDVFLLSLRSVSCPFSHPREGRREGIGERRRRRRRRRIWSGDECRASSILQRLRVKDRGDGEEGRRVLFFFTVEGKHDRVEAGEGGTVGDGDAGDAHCRHTIVEAVWVWVCVFVCVCVCASERESGECG